MLNHTLTIDHENIKLERGRNSYPMYSTLSFYQACKSKQCHCLPHKGKNRSVDPANTKL